VRACVYHNGSNPLYNDIRSAQHDRLTTSAALWNALYENDVK